MVFPAFGDWDGGTGIYESLSYRLSPWSRVGNKNLRGQSHLVLRRKRCGSDSLRRTCLLGYSTSPQCTLDPSAIVRHRGWILRFTLQIK